MADEPPCVSSLSLRVVDEDLPDLIQIEARVAADGWSGIARAYTSPHALAEEASGLLNWTERLNGDYTLEAGADTGIGWLSLRWYPVDRAGHIACQIQMATREDRRGPAGVRRLSLGFLTEASSVQRFARQLSSLAGSLTGEAVLSGDAETRGTHAS